MTWIPALILGVCFMEVKDYAEEVRTAINKARE